MRDRTRGCAHSRVGATKRLCEAPELSAGQQKSRGGIYVPGRSGVPRQPSLEAPGPSRMVAGGFRPSLFATTVFAVPPWSRKKIPVLFLSRSAACSLNKHVQLLQSRDVHEWGRFYLFFIWHFQRRFGWVRKMTPNLRERTPLLSGTALTTWIIRWQRHGKAAAADPVKLPAKP